MVCWGKLLWVSVLFKELIIDLMFYWTTLKRKKKTAYFIVPWKTGFVFKHPLHCQLWQMHTVNFSQVIESPSCAGAPSSPTGLQRGGWMLPGSCALKSTRQAVTSVMLWVPGWGRARWARVWKRSRPDGVEEDPGRRRKLGSTWEESFVGDVIIRNTNTPPGKWQCFTSLRVENHKLS